MAENYDYLTYALHDSIYPNGQNKEDETTKTGTDEGGGGTALNFFRIVEGINNFICRRKADTSDDLLICTVCSDQLIRMIEKTYKSNQEQARSYSVTIHEYQTKYPDYLTKLPLSDPLRNPVCHVARPSPSSRQSDECEIDLLRHIKDIEKQRTKTMAEMEAELILFASLEAEVLSLDADIDATLNHSDRAVREMNYLNSENGSICVLFDLSITSRVSSSIRTSIQRSESQLGRRDGDELTIIAVINGMRLMYLPSTSDNLNWAEINRAWSCLSLLVCCLRNRGGLSEKSILLIEEGSVSRTNVIQDDHLTGTRITLQLRPLRRRTLILLSLDYFEHESQKNSTLEEVLFLCGEGKCQSGNASDKGSHKEEQDEYSDDMESDIYSTSFSNQDLHTEEHRQYQYYQAVIALGAVVCATARDLNRVDCLTDSMHSLDLSPLLDLCPFNTSQRRRSHHIGDLVGQMCLSLKNLIS